MFLRITLYLALAVFAFGLVFKVSTWFRYNIGVNPGGITPGRRVFSALKGIFSTLFSAKILVLLRVFLLDVLFQFRILKESPLRWVMHMSIFVGFMLLLIMHALDNILVYGLVPDYSPTLNPYLFLRNLGFLLVIVGLAIALYRRFVLKAPRLVTNAMDHYVIIILAVVMFSGLFLEGVKIVSYSSFRDMVEDYGDSSDTEAVRALESYWVKEFGTVSPNVKAPFDPEILQQGKEIHEMSCQFCHSKPQWAVAGYGVAAAIRPVALPLDRANAAAFLWYIHILASFVGLAYLPFSKMFHVFASPVSLLANAVMDENSDQANIATRQAMELDACTHCGTCSMRCSVGVSFERVHNPNILPSEKLKALKAVAAGRQMSDKELRNLREGLYFCTNCYRCTGVCPAGINLQDLWFNARENLLHKSDPEFLTLSPLSLYRGLKREDIKSGSYEKPMAEVTKALSTAYQPLNGQVIHFGSVNKRFKKQLSTLPNADTYVYCFTCKTCTSACPVVNNFENPPEALGLVPHQILAALHMGLSDPVLGSDMLWSCLGCYQCQDSCPQGVKVTDLLYALKNLAMEQQMNGKTKKTSG